MYRGSRKHILDWTGLPSFREELAEFLALESVRFLSTTPLMPQGIKASAEARLETFGPRWLPGHSVWTALSDWWLYHKVGANTPNWDMALGCEIEGRPGLIMVEAKANWPELGTGGKALSRNATEKSRDNHQRIGHAIDEACTGWCSLDERVAIVRDSHYQLANRLAFTWKLATLGIPVVLLYLGFTGDEGIRDVGQPFTDDFEWQQAFERYIKDIFPTDLVNKRLEIESVPVWLLSRSRPVIEISGSRVTGAKL